VTNWVNQFFFSGMEEHCPGSHPRKRKEKKSGGTPAVHSALPKKKQKPDPACIIECWPMEHSFGIS